VHPREASFLRVVHQQQLQS